MRPLASLLLSGLMTLATVAQTPATYRFLAPAKQKQPAVQTVLICESKSAYAYHAYECRGLARCSHTVSRITVAQARERGYQPCKICY